MTYAGERRLLERVAKGEPREAAVSTAEPSGDLLDHALRHIDDFGTDVLVVALGLDAFVDDPFKGLAITTKGFARIAETFSGEIAGHRFTSGGG